MLIRAFKDTVEKIPRANFERRLYRTTSRRGRSRSAHKRVAGSCGLISEHSQRGRRCDSEVREWDERAPLTVARFVSLFHESLSLDLGCETEAVEKGGLVREGNNALSSAASSSGPSHGGSGREPSQTRHAQTRAQYGRIMFGATDDIRALTRLRRDEIFADIGHGIGNTVMQMACTVGCASRGVELMSSRAGVATRPTSPPRHGGFLRVCGFCSCQKPSRISRQSLFSSRF